VAGQMLTRPRKNVCSLRFALSSSRQTKGGHLIRRTDSRGSAITYYPSLRLIKQHLIGVHLTNGVHEESQCTAHRRLYYLATTTLASHPLCKEYLGIHLLLGT
jgi:hypothetical protein